MRVIPPLSITNAMLTSSTAAEPAVDEAAYNSGTTYGLADEVILGSPTATVTMTIAAPCVVTWNAHGLNEWTPLVLTTTIALPTGLTAGVIYYVTNPTTNTFQLSATIGGAPITTTGSQSGVHTATAQVHRKYVSLQASNTGKPPPTTLASSSVWWVDNGPTNKWAMFDLLRNTATILPSPLTAVITPGMRVNSIALLGVVANSVTVSMTSVQGGGTVYSVTTSMDTRQVLNWYDYFFEPFSTNPVLVFFNLPPYSDAVITVTMTTTSGNVWCGSCVLGTYVSLGTDPEEGAIADAVDYSTISTDDFGNTTLIQRRNAPKISTKTLLEKGAVNKVLALRDNLRAMPAVWSGLDDVTHDYGNVMLILGIYKTFQISLDHPTHAIVSCELQEIT